MLSRDILTAPAEEIRHITVDMTVVDGKIVYEGRVAPVPSVIPAEAGIQGRWGVADGGSPLHPAWIPAFAGMT